MYIESVHGRRRYGWASLYGVLDWPHSTSRRRAPRSTISPRTRPSLATEPIPRDSRGSRSVSLNCVRRRWTDEEARADLERLASLGYVGGTGSPAIGRRLDDRPRPDPKDRIAAIPSLERVSRSGRRQDHEGKEGVRRDAAHRSGEPRGGQSSGSWLFEPATRHGPSRSSARGSRPILPRRTWRTTSDSRFPARGKRGSRGGLPRRPLGAPRVHRRALQSGARAAPPRTRRRVQQRGSTESRRKSPDSPNSTRPAPRCAARSRNGGHPRSRRPERGAQNAMVVKTGCGSSLAVSHTSKVFPFGSPPGWGTTPARTSRCCGSSPPCASSRGPPDGDRSSPAPDGSR